MMFLLINQSKSEMPRSSSDPQKEFQHFRRWQIACRLFAFSFYGNLKGFFTVFRGIDSPPGFFGVKAGYENILTFVNWSCH
jgi:hypothetical protein